MVGICARFRGFTVLSPILLRCNWFDVWQRIFSGEVGWSESVKVSIKCKGENLLERSSKVRWPVHGLVGYLLSVRGDFGGPFL